MTERPVLGVRSHVGDLARWHGRRAGSFHRPHSCRAARVCPPTLSSGGTARARGSDPATGRRGEASRPSARTHRRVGGRGGRSGAGAIGNCGERSRLHCPSWADHLARAAHCHAPAGRTRAPGGTFRGPGGVRVPGPRPGRGRRRRSPGSHGRSAALRRRGSRPDPAEPRRNGESHLRGPPGGGTGSFRLRHRPGNGGDRCGGTPAIDPGLPYDVDGKLAPPAR